MIPKRSTDEVIVLSLSALSNAGLALFSVIRFARGDLTVALLDFVGFFLGTLIFIYVYRTHNIRIAGPLFGFGSLLGATLLVVIAGPEERYLLYPTIVIAFFLMKPTWALLSSLVAVLVVSTYVLQITDLFGYGKFLVSVSGCFLFSYIFARERNVQRDELLSLSTLDPLTSVGNRRAFDSQVEEFLRMHNRRADVCSLLLIDLDNFKQINDSLGHEIGDQVLIRVAEIIAERVRAGDSAFRYGGDEYAVLAKGDGVETLAEDLCHRISQEQASADLWVSVSIGVATLSDDESVSDWVKRSDSALYKAKAEGRNRVSLA